MIWSVGKGALVVKAGRLGQEEWNLAAIELELTSSTRGKKQRGNGCFSLGRGAQEQNSHKEMTPNSQIPPTPRDFGPIPTTLAWGSGVHRKFKECGEREEAERMSAIERNKQFKAYS